MAFSPLVLSLVALFLSGSPGLTHGKGLYATEAEARNAQNNWAAAARIKQQSLDALCQ